MSTHVMTFALNDSVAQAMATLLDKGALAAAIGHKALVAELELVANDLIHLLRVSLTLGGLHYLAHEEPQHFFFATTQLVELFRVCCDQVIDDLSQGAVVAQLSEVERLNEFVDIAGWLSAPQRIKQGLCCF